MPAILAGSTLEGSASKNSCTVIRVSLSSSGGQSGRGYAGTGVVATGGAARRGQEEAERDPEQRREARSRSSAVSRSTASATAAEGDGRDPAETHREADRETGRHADVPRQVHLAQHHRDPERADDADPDDHQRRGAGDPADEDEDEDQRREHRLGDEQRPPQAEAIRDGAEQQRPDGAGEEHQREQPVSVRLGLAERDAHNGTNVSSPNQATLRRPITPPSTTIARTSSSPSA